METDSFILFIKTYDIYKYIAKDIDYQKQALFELMKDELS